MIANSIHKLYYSPQGEYHEIWSSKFKIHQKCYVIPFEANFGKMEQHKIGQ